MRISDWSSDVCSSDLPLFRADARLSAGSAPVLLTPVETAGLCDIASGADAKRWASDYPDRSQVRPVDARLSEALAAPSDLSTARAVGDVAERERGVGGKSVVVSVELGGARIIKK